MEVFPEMVVSVGLDRPLPGRRQAKSQPRPVGSSATEHTHIIQFIESRYAYTIFLEEFKM